VAFRIKWEMTERTMMMEWYKVPQRLGAEREQQVRERKWVLGRDMVVIWSTRYL
jgi:hypothetical protein